MTRFNYPKLQSIINHTDTKLNDVTQDIAQMKSEVKTRSKRIHAALMLLFGGNRNSQNVLVV